MQNLDHFYMRRRGRVKKYQKTIDLSHFEFFFKLSCTRGIVFDSPQKMPIFCPNMTKMFKCVQDPLHSSLACAIHIIIYPKLYALYPRIFGYSLASTGGCIARKLQLDSAFLSPKSDFLSNLQYICCKLRKKDTFFLIPKNR